MRVRVETRLLLVSNWRSEYLGSEARRAYVDDRGPHRRNIVVGRGLHGAVFSHPAAAICADGHSSVHRGGVHALKNGWNERGTLSKVAPEREILLSKFPPKNSLNLIKKNWRGRRSNFWIWHQSISRKNFIKFLLFYSYLEYYYRKLKIHQSVWFF